MEASLKQKNQFRLGIYVAYHMDHWNMPHTTTNSSNRSELMSRRQKQNFTFKIWSFL